MYDLTNNWENKGVYIFPNGICPKVNGIVGLEFELTCYNSADYRCNHYATRTMDKGQKRNTRITKTAKSRKNQNVWRKGKLQVL